METFLIEFESGENEIVEIKEEKDLYNIIEFKSIENEPATDDFNLESELTIEKEEIAEQKAIEVNYKNPPKIPNRKRLKCQICNKVCASTNNFKRHLDSHKEKVECSICLNKYSQANIEKHFEYHKRTSGCKICFQIFKNVKELNEHLKSHSEEEIEAMKEKFKAENVTRKEVSEGESKDSKSHENDDEMEEKFKELPANEEEIKSKTYNTRRTKKKRFPTDYLNLTLNQPKHEFKCIVCGLKFMKKAFWNEHLNTHEKFECSICLQKVLDLNYHMKFHVTKKLPNRDFECDKCDKTFKSANVLKVHSKVHIERVQCQFCSKMLQPACLEIHNEKEHKQINCKICSEKFVNKREFEKHRKSHKFDIKKVQCKFCSTMVRSVSMKMHIEKKHKQNNCSICSEIFFSKQELQNHWKTNHKWHLKFEECKFCNLKFPLESHFKLHQSECIYRSKKLFKCKFCRVTFLKLEELESHLLKEHAKDIEVDDVELEDPLNYSDCEGQSSATVTASENEEETLTFSDSFKKFTNTWKTNKQTRIVAEISSEEFL
jgi:hypothetical protein